MATRIQLRRDTAANWTSANPLLADGEPGYETDTKKFKYGNGVDNWNILPYQAGGGAQGETGLTGATGVGGGGGGATGVQGETGLSGETGLGTQGATGVGGGGSSVITEYEIRLGASATVAGMISGATKVPAGWNLDDGILTLGNITSISGLGGTVASDLIIEHGTASYLVNIEIIQNTNSGPAAIQGFFNQHYDNLSANFRSNPAGLQSAYYNFLAITASTKPTYLIVRLASIV